MEFKCLFLDFFDLEEGKKFKLQSNININENDKSTESENLGPLK